MDPEPASPTTPEPAPEATPSGPRAPIARRRKSRGHRGDLTPQSIFEEMRDAVREVDVPPEVEFRRGRIWS
jgi:hypothetical protein